MKTRIKLALAFGLTLVLSFVYHLATLLLNQQSDPAFYCGIAIVSIGLVVGPYLYYVIFKPRRSNDEEPKNTVV